MTRQQEDQAVYSIGAVARMLDIPTSTLRAWEERYSVITPRRSEASQRRYSRAQVEQLRFIKSRLDSRASLAQAQRVLQPERARQQVSPPELERAVGSSSSVSSVVDVLYTSVPARHLRR